MPESGLRVKESIFGLQKIVYGKKSSLGELKSPPRALKLSNDVQPTFQSTKLGVLAPLREEEDELCRSECRRSEEN
jgi:hypothetical protein